MKINKKQKKLLESREIALGTIKKDGNPNVIPVAYAKVIEPNKIVITDNYMKNTNQAIINEPRVCLAVWSKDWEEGYKISGKAKYIIEGKWLKFAKEMKENKGMPAKGAIIVNVKK